MYSSPACLRHHMLKSLQVANQQLMLDPPAIMGILNITPDSFSDGGKHFGTEEAVSAAQQMLEDGADIIDVGGESTRPGAADVQLEEELRRVVPIIEAIASTGALVSVDTSKPEVMRASVDAGAFMVNDVRALQADKALEEVAALPVTVCLMHMAGQPRTMQESPTYTDVVGEVCDFLRDRIDACVSAGIERERIVLDPGFGFGKNLQHNLCLLKHLSVITEIGLPVLAGLSRKSMFGAILGTEVDDRLHASVAGALLAAERGASILRVHDVRETAQALSVLAALNGAENAPG